MTQVLLDECLNYKCKYYDERCEENCNAPNDYATGKGCDPRAPQDTIEQNGKIAQQPKLNILDSGSKNL